MSETPTPRTDALCKSLYGQTPQAQVIGLVKGLHTLERELAEAKEKLDYVHAMGIRFALMKSSDKPEPYLMHVWSEDSDHDKMFREWSHSIGWEDNEAKLKAENAQLRKELALSQATLEQRTNEANLAVILAEKFRNELEETRTKLLVAIAEVANSGTQWKAVADGLAGTIQETRGKDATNALAAYNKLKEESK